MPNTRDPLYTNSLNWMDTPEMTGRLRALAAHLERSLGVVLRLVVRHGVDDAARLLAAEVSPRTGKPYGDVPARLLAKHVKIEQARGAKAAAAKAQVNRERRAAAETTASTS